MTLKLGDLELFCINMRKESGWTEQISQNRVFYFIAVKYGTSPYVRRTIMGAILEFGLLIEIGPGIFRFRGNEKEEKERLSKEAAEVLGE